MKVTIQAIALSFELKEEEIKINVEGSEEWQSEKVSGKMIQINKEYICTTDVMTIKANLGKEYVEIPIDKTEEKSERWMTLPGPKNMGKIKVSINKPSVVKKSVNFGGEEEKSSTP